MNHKIKNSNFRKAAGFTLMELVVVTMVIGVLTATAFSNFHRHRIHVNHTDSLIRVISMMKEARSWSSTSRAVYDTSQPPGSEVYIPVEGYGVYFEQSSIPEQSRVILFANTSTAGEDLNQYSTSDLVERTYIVHRDVVFELMEGIDLGPPATNTPITRATVIFRPPLAEVTINDNAIPADVAISASPTSYHTLEVTLARSNAPETATPGIISINKTAGFPDLNL